MFVWWNGDTNPCDVDYKSKLKVGNIKDSDISMNAMEFRKVYITQGINIIRMNRKKG